MIIGRKLLPWLASVSIVAFAAVAAPAQASVGGFGIETLENRLTNEGGSLAVQAGSHPATMTTTIVFDRHEVAGNGGGGSGIVPNGNPRDIEVNFPPGLIVNPNATEVRCTETQLLSSSCPAAAAVGVVAGSSEILPGFESQVYNMVAPPGIPADLAFNIAGFGLIVHIVGTVRTGGDYGLTGKISDILQFGGAFSATVTLNGFPAGRAGKPLLTMPTSCGAPLTVTASASSWQGESAQASTTSLEGGRPVRVGGCESLHFNPTLTVHPTTAAADSPSGLSVEVSVPQEESAGGLAEADLRDAVVTLPAGMSVSASAAGGLGACAPQEIHLTTAQTPTCPDSSKIGSVEVVTPLLETPLHGWLYLAQQGINSFPQEMSNPFKSLIALYLVAEGAGVVVKVPGEVRLDPVTGQLTTHFGEDPTREEENPEVKGHLLLPQLPFSHLTLNLFGGFRAPLSTPTECGIYTATSRLTPWSAPESGLPATPSSSFEINEDCHGPEFTPSFAAGTESNRAGSFSPFTLTLRREDGEEEFGRILVKTPPGLLGSVSSVPLCQEPQAAQGTCGQASLIGHVSAGVGVGPDQFYVPGQVYLTGPYNGAPFGLSIVVPAVAGPFNLGTEVVRAAINIDPHTAVLTVTSNPFPEAIQGIPLQIRTVNVTIDREDFIFNPTSCTPTAIEAAATSTVGASASLSSRFQAAECASLGFKPKFAVSTSGHTSRADGASLDVKLTYPKGSQGTEANIRSVKVDLPKRLPSRLTTLQKACPVATFEANPASCPAASIVGIVRATTPVLPVTLSGPVYFVSHGGEAFPQLEVILQGDGVRVDLAGSTFISKAGVTSSTFKTVPDVPVASFELYLPEGSYSALAANGNLCKGSLKMPTAFVAQNGLEIHESTPIAVIGCPKAKKAGVARKGRKAVSDRHGKGRK